MVKSKCTHKKQEIRTVNGTQTQVCIDCGLKTPVIDMDKVMDNLQKAKKGKSKDVVAQATAQAVKASAYHPVKPAKLTPVKEKDVKEPEPKPKIVKEPKTKEPKVKDGKKSILSVTLDYLENQAGSFTSGDVLTWIKINHGDMTFKDVSVGLHLRALCIGAKSNPAINKHACLNYDKESKTFTKD